MHDGSTQKLFGQDHSFYRSGSDQSSGWNPALWKTVLLGQIKDVLLQRNIPAQNIIQANFESMRFRNTRTAETLYDYIAEKVEGCTGKIYILLDEIQEVERWQIAINSLRVDFDCDIYLTGSNSKLLSGELATYLSGRYIQIQVFPFRWPKQNSNALKAEPILRMKSSSQTI